MYNNHARIMKIAQKSFPMKIVWKPHNGHETSLFPNHEIRGNPTPQSSTLHANHILESQKNTRIRYKAWKLHIENMTSSLTNNKNC